MTQHASGPFAVKLTPQQPDSEVAKAANLGRMTIDKQFHGDLNATSKGEMIAAQTQVKGSAGYVAIEKDFVGKRPRTQAVITRAGRRAYDAHLQYLRDILAGVVPDAD